MRCRISGAVVVLGLFAVNLQQVPAQPAGSLDATGAVRSSAATQAAPENGTMNQDKAKSGAASQPASKPAQGNLQVVMQTSMGKVVIELYPDKAPITVENFLKYVDDGFYDGTIFHRVIPTFMIQGGGFGTDKKEKQTRAPIKNEAANGLKNARGTVAMARTNDPNSATGQFFINVTDNAFLNYSGPGPSTIGYAVFGKVVEGMDVVDKIKNTPTGMDRFTTRHGPAPFENVPKETVVIESIKRQ